MKTIVTCFVVVGLAVVALAYYAGRPVAQPVACPSAPPAAQSIAKTKACATSEPHAGAPTAKVERGNLICTVPAKGTVKLEEVEVGAQITGMIADFGTDLDNPSKPLDCGSRVRKGMVLAHIDPTIYQAQVDYAEAALMAAKANLVQLKAHCDQTAQEWKRAKSLLPVKAIADTDYDLALSNFRMAESNVIAGDAAVRESEASLLIAKTNLDYTIIKSPSDGVIIDRRVAVGQTVVASFNAPGLFLIAKESRQVQVWAAVDEADIGYIRPGAPVRFTLNACADESFEGKVAQVRLSPTKEGNAVKYTVVVSADNFGSMLPDMTANLQFEVERRFNVLLLPNDAVRRLPQSPQTASDVQATALSDASKAGGGKKALSPAKPSGAHQLAKFSKERKVNRHLWVKEGGLVRHIDVELGVSNGSMTEVRGTNVREGMEVILAEVCLNDGR
jgi:HlyD family secretion protein